MRIAEVKDLIPGAVFRHINHNFKFKVIKSHNNLYWIDVYNSGHYNRIENPECWIKYYFVFRQPPRKICNHD